MEALGYIIFGVLCAIALILIIGIGFILRGLERIENALIGFEAIFCMLNHIKSKELKNMFEKGEINDEKNTD